MDAFYTNSTLLPVGHTDDLFEAMNLQEGLQTKYTGGSVFHVFLGERLPSGKEVKTLFKKIFSKSKIPYFSLTPTFSICPTHGYLNGEHHKCNKEGCEKECEVYSRITGYLRPISNWNLGKQQEFKQRKTYKV